MMYGFKKENMKLLFYIHQAEMLLTFLLMINMKQLVYSMVDLELNTRTTNRDFDS